MVINLSYYVSNKSRVIVDKILIIEVVNIPGVLVRCAFPTESFN